MPTASPLAHRYLFSALSLMACVAVAYSQDAGSGSSRSDPARATRPQTPEEFHDTFWRYLVKKDAAYNTWKALEHEPPKDEVENPHSMVSRTYANEVAAKDLKNMPLGSILVREDYDDKRKRQSVSVLYRVKDYAAGAPRSAAGRKSHRRGQGFCGRHRRGGRSHGGHRRL